MNSEGFDHLSASPANSKKADEQTKQLSTQHSKRVSAPGTAREKSPLPRPSSSEKSHRFKNYASLNGSRSPSTHEISSQGTLATKRSPLKPINGHKDHQASIQSSPATPTHLGVKAARKSAARDQFLPGRASTDAAPDRDSPLIDSSMPRNNSSLTNGFAHAESRRGDGSNLSIEHDLVDKPKRHSPRKSTRISDALEKSSSRSVAHENSPKPEPDDDDVPMLDVSQPPGSGKLLHYQSEIHSSPTAQSHLPLSTLDFEQRLRDYLARLKADHQYHVKVRSLVSFTRQGSNARPVEIMPSKKTFRSSKTAPRPSVQRGFCKKSEFNCETPRKKNLHSDEIAVYPSAKHGT